LVGLTGAGFENGFVFGVVGAIVLFPSSFIEGGMEKDLFENST
jgi:hypothetical protein